MQELAKETIKLLETKTNEYKKIFNFSNEKIIVNYFDSLEDFKNFIYDLRGEKGSLPEYATGTYDNGMVNAYINPEKQLYKKYTASHELFHILYMKYILKNDYSKRVVWYDEGMAQFVSGEDDYLKDTKRFKTYYLKVKEQTKIIPDLNKIQHGSSFYNDDYNGYDLSYLSVRYLSEILSQEDFYKLMSNFSSIKKYGIDKMFKYYDDLIK